MSLLVVFTCCWMCDIKGPDYYNPPILSSHSNGEHFVGSETCRECHADIYTSHALTAHYNTSGLANAKNIKGSFQKIDIVIGSGVKGKSYLTWEEDRLFQLQASYYPPADNWINSPGFPNQIIQRPIRDGCLKCHVTFATNRDFSGKGNQYNKDLMIYGVDCEKCHRPAQQHVVFHRNNPEVKESKYILKIDTLTRQLRLDACAQCHSGPRDAILQGNSFTYLTGERLDEYSRNFYTGFKTSELDVHGNQYGLLTSSKCFMESPQMDCSTCHDPHSNQRNNHDYFNDKCISCHSTKTVSCSGDIKELKNMGNNCISCHMPTKASKTMSIQLTSDSLQTGVLIRTHLIGIYDEKPKSPGSELDSTSINNLKQFIESN